MLKPTDKTRFTWPPSSLPLGASTPAPMVHPEAITGRAPSIFDRLRGAFVDIEREWLDPTALPLERRAVEAGWSPDEPGAFCDRCGRDIGPYESGEFGCASCARSRLPWQCFIRLGGYIPPLSDWICEVKFTRWRILGLGLGRMLARRMREEGWIRVADTTNAVVVPVPTTVRRRLSRGIDHAGVISRGVAIELGLPLVKGLRRRHRPSQRAVPASERARNVSRCFSRRWTAAIAGRDVILIDDVMTTGATLRAAANALRGEGGMGGPRSVSVGVLAVTPTDRIA